MSLSDKEKNVLQMVKGNKSYENYFFAKVKDTKWFFELKNQGYFSPKKAPKAKLINKKGYFISKWNVLSYLEEISQRVNLPGNEKYIDGLLTIIKEVSNYKYSKGQKIDNYHTWYSFVKILLKLPNNKISLEIIDLIPVWLDSKFSTMLPGSVIIKKLLPKFLTGDSSDIKKAEKIFDYITSLKLPKNKKKHEDKNKDIKLRIEPYLLKELFKDKKYLDKIGEKCSEEIILTLASKIKKIIQRVEEGTYKSFYDKSRILDEPLDILTYALKNILLSKSKITVNVTNSLLKGFLEDQYFYFNKMALYIIGNKLENYKELFWDILNSDKGISILQNTLSFGDELKHILQNFRELNDKQRKLLEDKINKSAELKEYKENPKLYKALYKQKIYKALSYDSFFKKLHNKMKKMTNFDIELRPAIGKIETRWGFGLSPLSKEEILQKSNTKLAEYLSTFETKDFWKGPTVDGLSVILEEIVKERPEKFVDDLNPFSRTGNLYIYNILLGIRDACKKNIYFNWDKLLEFIKKYISTDDFWNDQYVVKDDDLKANHFWVLGIIGELITAGIKEDSQSFSEKSFVMVQQILFSILDKLLGNNEEILKDQFNQKDFVTYTLNSTFGKITKALFLLGYRIKKIKRKEKTIQPVNWDMNIKSKYEELLKNKIIEGYVWFGIYLSNFYLLDKIWTENQIKQISTKDEDIWEPFMQGYLYGNGVDHSLYTLIRSHYKAAIDYKFKDDFSSERLIQHICEYYLKGIEKIDDKNSLFRKLLDKWDSSQIEKIIGYFWMQNDWLNPSEESTEDIDKHNKIEPIKKSIIDYWKWVYINKYKDKNLRYLKKEDKEILSDLSKLTIFLEKIDDESFEWLELSASYLHINYNLSFFIKYLDILKDKDDFAGEYVGKILLRILDYSIPDYDIKNICSIVEYLYTSNYKGYAKNICEKYGEKTNGFIGFEDLRFICEKYCDT